MLSEEKKKQIDKIVFDTLKVSGSLGVYPTPVDKVLKYADLRVNSGIDLSHVPEHLLAKWGLALKRAITKVQGALVRNDRVILLDSTLNANKKKFVQLHEAGHDLLYWQNRLLLFLDDKETLDPDTKELFEAEANYFASAVLFQQELFFDQLRTMPLDLASAMALAKKFGSSIHAALRRYVEHNHKRCILLIINKESSVGYGSLKFTIRNNLQSESFTKDFGTLEWGTYLDFEFPFVQDYMYNRKHLKSDVILQTSDGDLDCKYDFFNNSYNAFVFIYPKGEIIKSRTSFIIAE